ncbi:cysteine hydrolase family protein [Rhodospira trueperi]|uniref:Nicotinamidase-related amidase n=1 Tax=Rhodospira trueperi TaxID=69960 RepID=A0A1G7DBT0_9PROT|nr:isochorismatase family cysteine hydrolase [Rhodospira trueperi]SDE49007.1 Nicotinamidase-related amidase [Rhodospira trueperi]
MSWNWKTAYRSFYYATAPEPEDLTLDPAATAVLVIDIQNTYVTEPEEPAEAERWRPFLERMRETVIPRTVALTERARRRGIEVLFARIACLTEDGRDRSLSQKKPGFNNLLLPKAGHPSQMVPALTPKGDEIVVLKTTDSALTGTNLRLILHNLGIRTVIVAGIFTDQCVSSTVRSLADESFEVIVVEDCCAAATQALHDHELAVLNMIYAHVVRLSDLDVLL